MPIYDYPMYLTEDEIGQLRKPQASPLGAANAPTPTTQASQISPLVLLGVGLFLGYMVTKLSKNHLRGGVGDNYDPEDFDSEDLDEGTDVEFEHTDDPEIAQEIAIDHLTEDRDYYRKLKKMVEPKQQKPSTLKSAAQQRQEIIDDPMSMFRGNPDLEQNEDEDEDECETDSGFVFRLKED